MLRNLLINNIQIALFFPPDTSFKAISVANAVDEEFGDLFWEDPNIITLPPNAPIEIPRIIYSQKDIAQLSNAMSIDILPLSVYSNERYTFSEECSDRRFVPFDFIDQAARLKNFQSKRVNVFSSYEYTASEVDDNGYLYLWLRIFNGSRGKDCLKPQKSESSVIMGNSFETSNKSRLYTTDKIIWDEKIFLLNAQISFYIIHHNNYYVINFDPLDIEVVEKTIEDAVDSFSEEFAMIWRVYGQEEEANLSKDALKLKQTIRKMVKNEDQMI